MAEAGRPKLLAVLVTQAEDEGEREKLLVLAEKGGTANLTLAAPPANDEPHVLEVHGPGSGAPLVLLAKPNGRVPGGLHALTLSLPGAKPKPNRATMAYGAPPSVPPPPESSGRYASMSPSSSESVGGRYASAPPAAKSASASLKESVRPPPLPPIRSAPTPPAKSAPTLPAPLVRKPTPAHPNAPRASRLVGQELAGGKLVIEACVGEGGAGTVFRARHRDLHMPVAVKVLHESFEKDPEFCRRFQAEALAASRLDHANLTRVFDYGQEPEGFLYLAMEFLDGKSLRDILHEEKRMPLPRVVALMTQVCSGLLHAHARNVIHRDVKPENLVVVKGLDDDGRETDIVKVCDFGIAHRGEKEIELCGTPEYMAPEQFKGEEPDAQSDVYSCGIVLYELLTGDVPITGDDPNQIGMRQLTMEPEPPSRHVPDLDPRVDRLVMKALAKEREERHMSVRELRKELRALVEEPAPHTAGYWRDLEPSAPPASSRSARRDSAPKPALTKSPNADWLETDRHTLMQSMTPAATTSSMPGAMGSIAPGAPTGPPPPPEKDVARVLKQIVDTRDPEPFLALSTALDPKIRALMQQGHALVVLRLRMALEQVASERVMPGMPSRSGAAQKLLEIFGSATLLGAIAAKALDGTEDKENAARKLIARAGGPGAYALYSARLRHGVFEARERFVAILQEVGTAATPVIVAGLDKLQEKLEVPGAVGVAEDLLKAIPNVPEPRTAGLLMRYAERPQASVAVLATAKLARIAREDARELLVRLASSKDDRIAIAAINGIRDLGPLGADMVRELESIVLGVKDPKASIRIAAVQALAKGSSEGRPPARALLAKVLATQQDGGTHETEDLVVVVASTYLDIGGDGEAVAERWKGAAGSLKTRLEELLRERRVL